MNNLDDSPASPFQAVLECQEQLYLGRWDSRQLLDNLSARVPEIDGNPLAVLQTISILRILREEQDPATVDAFFHIIEANIPSHGAGIWPTDAGIIVLLEMLD